MSFEFQSHDLCQVVRFTCSTQLRILRSMLRALLDGVLTNSSDSMTKYSLWPRGPRLPLRSPWGKEFWKWGGRASERALQRPMGGGGPRWASVGCGRAAAIHRALRSRQGCGGLHAGALGSRASCAQGKRSTGRRETEAGVGTAYGRVRRTAAPVTIGLGPSKPTDLNHDVREGRCDGRGWRQKRKRGEDQRPCPPVRGRAPEEGQRGLAEGGRGARDCDITAICSQRTGSSLNLTQVSS